jgi:hypothetical protein
MICPKVVLHAITTHPAVDEFEDLRTRSVHSLPPLQSNEVRLTSLCLFILSAAV